MVESRFNAPTCHLHLKDGQIPLVNHCSHPLLDNFPLLHIQRVDILTRLNLGDRHGARVGKDHRVRCQAVILCPNARKKFPLCFGNSQTLVGALDVFGHFVPRAEFCFRRRGVVGDFVKVQLRQVSAPSGQWLSEEDFQGLQANLSHPIGFAFVMRNGFHDLFAQALWDDELITGIFVAEAVFVNRQLTQFLLLFCHRLSLLRDKVSVARNSQQENLAMPSC